MTQIPPFPFGPAMLEGQTALVTGASGGIGRASAAMLAQAGADLILTGRDGGALDAVAAGIIAAGGAAQVVVCDLLDADGMRALVERLERLDILVNCAGINIPQAAADISADAYERTFALNVRAPLLLMQAAFPRMRARGSGAVVNVSSQLGHVAGPGRAVYSASKHALEGLSKSLAVEMAPHGVRVNCVAPTVIETPMSRTALTEPNWRAHLLGQIPMGRFGAVEEVAAAVVFLASPAAALITGTSLLVDGGWTAR